MEGDLAITQDMAAPLHNQITYMCWTDHVSFNWSLKYTRHAPHTHTRV